MKMKIDLNADLGEGMDDAAILPYLTSANVACGQHAGSPELMDRTVRLALAHGVRIGAHPGYADRENFGRRDLHLEEDALKALVLYQVGALDGIARARGARLAHVKAHGALYNQAAKDEKLAAAFAEAVAAYDKALVLVGLAGGLQIAAAEKAGLSAAGEAFADRLYADDGSLVPRSKPGAVLHDPAEAAAQAVKLARSGHAQTICLHGDTPGAAAIARSVRAALEQAGVEIAPFGN
jgi:5-oxoprolinase (ATP-hydrolysing) subunit A